MRRRDCSETDLRPGSAEGGFAVGRTAATVAPAMGATAAHFRRFLLAKSAIDFLLLSDNLAPHERGARQQDQVKVREPGYCPLERPRAKVPSSRDPHGRRCGSELGTCPTNRGSGRTIARARSGAIG